ncbi:MAG: copper resistance protein CopC [Verrucomicrobiota bacterium]|nr:copper resistance protein CopC [Verrucomicrobiota bacterium]
MRRGFFAIFGLLAFAANVLAHSALERTQPKDGASLKEAPREIQMWFSEPIKVGLSTIEVRDAAGNQVDQRDLRTGEKTPALVRLSLPEKLAPGTYKVTWSAVAQDLHVGKGSFSFRIAP